MITECHNSHKHDQSFDYLNCCGALHALPCASSSIYCITNLLSAAMLREFALILYGTDREPHAALDDSLFMGKTNPSGGALKALKKSSNDSGSLLALPRLMLGLLLSAIWTSFSSWLCLLFI